MCPPKSLLAVPGKSVNGLTYLESPGLGVALPMDCFGNQDARCFKMSLILKCTFLLFSISFCTKFPRCLKYRLAVMSDMKASYQSHWSKRSLWGKGGEGKWGLLLVIGSWPGNIYAYSRINHLIHHILLYRLEFGEFIISLFEGNSGNQWRYLKRLVWNFCKLNYVATSAEAPKAQFLDNEGPVFHSLVVFHL